MEMNFIVTTLRFDLPEWDMLKGQHIFVRAEEEAPTMPKLIRNKNYKVPGDALVTVLIEGNFVNLHFYHINY